MKNKTVLLGVFLSLLVPGISTAQAQQWAIKGNFVESCSCGLVCPCNFGLEPSHHPCEGNALLEIESGHYGEVKLDGVSVVFALRLGEWVKYYVGETASDDQAKAAVAVLERANLTNGAKVLSTQKAKINVDRTPTVKFSVPESTVKGQDGRPIKIENLPSPFLTDYTQYRSLVTRHKSKDKNFSYSGTNGLVARVEASSD